MKHLKKFNESIKRKDIKEVIDEILDNLSSKKELSNSEKEFMEAASKDEVKDVSVPNPTGNFWADMSNPHNLGTMWIGKDGVWKELKSLEDEEEDEEIDRIEKSGKSTNEYWKRKKQESIIKEFPELKPILLELAKIKIENLERERSVIKKLSDFKSKIKDSDISQRLSYAMADLYSLENQFGYVLPELKMDDYGEYHISE